MDTDKYQSGTARTTQIGYVNRNCQKCHGHRGNQGNDHNATAYKMECLDCGCIYGANGTDVFQRRCPNCQNGAASISF